MADQERIAEEVGRARERVQTASSTERVLQSQVLVIDQSARDIARDALAQIEKHEEVCAERMADIREKMSDIKAALTGLQNRWWTASVSIIAALLSLSAFLIAKLTHIL